MRAHTACLSQGMREGEVLFEGSPKEIVENPEVKRVYLGDSFSEPRLGD